MARNTLVFDSVNDGPDHQVRIFDATGAQAGPILAAAHVGVGTYNYEVDVPAALATGWYAYTGYLTVNGRPRSSGEFYWDNPSQCIIDTEENELDAAAIEAAATAALTGYGAATGAEVSAVQTAVLADIAIVLTNLGNVNTAVGNVSTQIGSLNDVSVAQFEAALLNDGDGQALLAAISSNVEAAFNNDTDGSPTLSAIQGLVTAALTAYDAATNGVVTTESTDIQNAIAALSILTPADLQAALTTYDAATGADVTAAQTAIVNALPDATEANQQAMLTAIGAIAGIQSNQTTALNNILQGQTDANAECEIDIIQAADQLTHFVKGTATILRQWDITYVANPADPARPTVTFTQTT